MQPQLQAISKRYRIEEEIGRGGMATVYRALDTALGRQVAVKVLHPHLQSQPEGRARVAREARAVAKLHHPNIVEIHDYCGEGAETIYLVTEYIRGETLDAFIQRRRPRLPETGLLLAAPLCEALAHAHALGIIHRDIKPSNVMIRHDGTLKLMDFGIAQVLDAQGVTVTGTLIGSPAHMSPELIEGKPIDFRADVFSLGTLLYLLAVGELPFQGPNPHTVMKAILDGHYRAPEVASPRISAALAPILHRALARDPERRYEGVEMLLIDLRGYLGDLGLHDIPGELRAFFADPDGYEEQLQRRLVAARLKQGRAAITRRRYAEALAAFNQVLALDPSNWEVLGLLARLGRRRRWSKVALMAAVVAAGAFATWAMWPGAREPAGPRNAASSSTTAVRPTASGNETNPRAGPSVTGGGSAGAPVGPLRRPVLATSPKAAGRVAVSARPETRAAGTRRVFLAPAHTRRTRRRGGLRRVRRLARLLRRRAVAESPGDRTAEASSMSPPPAAAPTVPRPLSSPPSQPPPATVPGEAPAPRLGPSLPLVPRVVRINTWPKAVRISVDGRAVGWAGIINSLELLPGRHVIELTSPNCHPRTLTVEIPPHGPVRPVVARLAWRPGLLVVHNPQQAEVAVDGVYKGTSDRTITDPILIPIGTENPLGRSRVHVRLSKPGYQRVDRVDEVTAGRTTHLRIVLKPL